MRSGVPCTAAVACGLLLASQALAVELEPGDIVVVDGRYRYDTTDSPHLLRIDPTTGAQQDLGQAYDALSVAFDAQGRVLVGSGYWKGPGRSPSGVVRIDPATGESSFITRDGLLVSPTALVVEADGRIVVNSYDAGSDSYLEQRPTGSLVRIDPETGDQTLLSSGEYLFYSVGLDVLPDGDLLVADEAYGGGGPGAILRVDAATGAQQRITWPTLALPMGLVVAPQGAFFPTFRSRAVVRLDVATGEQAVVAEIDDPWGGFPIAIEASGTLVSAAGGFPISRILRIDPLTGATQVITAFDGFVTGLAVVPDPAIEAAMLRTTAGADSDQDRVADAEDNCIERWNPTQSDADRDGFGNLCDGDFNDDGGVGIADWLILGRAFGADAGSPRYDTELDLNDDGTIGATDFMVWSRGFSEPPGPSGLACAGRRPCP